MAYDTILYQRKGKIAYITLNRPQILNAYNDTMGDELLHAHREFDQDDDLHVLIISGSTQAQTGEATDTDSAASVLSILTVHIRCRTGHMN